MCKYAADIWHNIRKHAVITVLSSDIMYYEKFQKSLLIFNEIHNKYFIILLHEDNGMHYCQFVLSDILPSGNIHIESWLFNCNKKLKEDFHFPQKYIMSLILYHKKKKFKFSWGIFLDQIDHILKMLVLVYIALCNEIRNFSNHYIRMK